MSVAPAGFQISDHNDFSQLFELNTDTQKILFSHIFSFLDDIDDIDCINVLSKTCKFFNEILLDKFKSIQKIYKPLVDKKIFTSWQQIAVLPMHKDPLPNDLSFTQEQIKNIPKSLTRGCYENRPCIIFKTLIRKSDGTFSRYNFEILVYSKLCRWNYVSTYRLGSGDHITIKDYNNISIHFENLVKHRAATPLFYDYGGNSPFEGLHVNHDYDRWDPGNYKEYYTKITDDGKPIEELVSDE